MADRDNERRAVRCRLLISSQWVEGTFWVPELRNFVEHLMTLHEFEVLTDVTFLNSGHREEFFDVNRSAVRLVLPPGDECEPLIPKPSGSVIQHRVYALLEGGHLTGRLLLKREAYAVDVAKVIDACAANDTIIEINANPWRLDMDWRWWKHAKEKGVKTSINPDAHRPEQDSREGGVACGRFALPVVERHQTRPEQEPGERRQGARGRDGRDIREQQRRTP